jgi:hypothetical protein
MHRNSSQLDRVMDKVPKTSSSISFVAGSFYIEYSAIRFFTSIVLSSGK